MTFYHDCVSDIALFPSFCYICRDVVEAETWIWMVSGVSDEEPATLRYLSTGIGGIDEA